MMATKPRFTGSSPFLENAKSLVRPGGVIAVREIYHESFFATELHARLIFTKSLLVNCQIFSLQWSEQLESEQPTQEYVFFPVVNGWSGSQH